MQRLFRSIFGCPAAMHRGSDRKCLLSPCASLTVADRVRRLLTGLLPQLAKYRDNFAAAVPRNPAPNPNDTPLALLKLQDLLALALNLKITVECWGKPIPLLEVDLGFLEKCHPQISLKQPSFVLKPGHSVPLPIVS